MCVCVCVCLCVCVCVCWGAHARVCAHVLVRAQACVWMAQVGGIYLHMPFNLSLSSLDAMLGPLATNGRTQHMGAPRLMAHHEAVHKMRAINLQTCPH